MPYKNWHAARVNDPDKYVRMRYKNLADGIDAIIGFKEGGGSEIQAYRFDKEKYTAAEAKKWLKEHDIKTIDFEEADDTEESDDMPRKKKNEVIDDIPEIEDEVKQLDEEFSIAIDDGHFILTETIKDGKHIFKGRVNEAQVADELNQNGRIYKSEVLKEAFNEAKENLRGNGPMLMYSGHKVVDGKNYDGLEGVIGLIKDIEWDETKKTINLSEIEFPETEQAKEHIALINAGVKLQVSQRGEGQSHFEKGADGKLVEIVDKVKFKGWDFLPAGRASVTSANFTLVEDKGEEQMPKQITLDEDKLDELVRKVEERLKEKPKLLNEKEETTEEKPEVPEKNENTEKITAIQATLNEQNEVIQGFIAKEKKAEIKDIGTKAINEALATEEYKRFKPEQKAAILESVDLESLFGKVDHETEKIKTAALELLKNEITKLDKFLAIAMLNETGYPNRGTGNGITDVKVLHENIPGMEFISRVSADMNRYMDQENDYHLPKDHVNYGTLKKLLERYDAANYKQLLNESGEEFTVADVGIKNASISRAFIEAVWPRLTALEVCETGTMDVIQDIIPIESWLPAFSTEIHTDVTLLQPAESGALNVAGITITNYPILATAKNQSARLTSMGRATAKGLAIDPVVRNIAGLANYVKTILDRNIWELIIAKAQSYATTQVTSWTQLTRVGTTNEHYSAHEGWVKYEFVKAYDGNGNPSSAKLIPLFGTTSGNALQKVEAREGGGDNTALVYTDDYSINWPDGTVTLTAAGAVKCAGNLVEVKYTYTTNAKFWSIVPDTGVTLYSHLLNLAQQVGQAKVLVRNRYYEPNYVAMNIANEDLIGKGPQFTTSGYTQGNVKDAMAMVMNYDGQPVKKSTAIPQGWIIVGKTGGAIYYVHTPWAIEGPLAIDNTRDRYWQVEEYSATDVPVTGKFALVGITDLNT